MEALRGRIGPVVAAGALLACAGRAQADAVYDACIARSDGTNPAWAACGGQWLEREDARLNVAWKKVITGLEGQTRADLLAEQRAWIAYKDASCAFYANGDFGGDGEVVPFVACRAEVIAARTRQLEAIEVFFSL
jgi:uncharacterized protein YecT (DUF1311 family)